MRILTGVLGAAWLLAVIMSVVMFIITEPSDFGLTAGMNRVAVFFGWQLGALLVAILAAIAALTVKRPRGWTVNLAGFGPMAISGVFFLAVIGFVLWINLSKPAPQTAPPASPPATTEPAEPAVEPAPADEPTR